MTEEISLANIEGKKIDDFEILEKFAGGAFSVVHFARHIPTNSYCAAKIIDLGAQSNKCFRNIMREISVFMQVSHPHISSLYRLSLVNKILIFFMEYEENGTLLQYVNRTGGLKEAEANRIFIQLYDALRHVHFYHFLVHRDLKLENILLDKENNVKLIDFGLSGTFYCNILKSFVGTPGYTPPEIVAGNEYGESCDVWSLGVCLYMMITDYLPFTVQAHDYKAIIEESEKIRFPGIFSPALQDLLKQMLQPRPDRRISFMNIQNHPWMKGISIVSGNITPTPIVFYQVNGYNDILKFKRKCLNNPNLEVVQKTAEIAKTDPQNVISQLKTGIINEITTIYFILLKPLMEKPSPPVNQGLPPLKRPTAQRKKRAEIQQDIPRIAMKSKQKIRRQSVGPKQNIRKPLPR
ncbi:CAMK family protein kinase [Tritrichomonas foetus]|uniref:CAMK family protein kinase n=1 Tax=Tritrichomonas foetus TaxID=1144522 RepID=A0A1J4KL54_9EUKA|nr:CAMK family protein kinase [Tritrichomonas foetus]|eukprot:OHT12033.1 CAMK family protein kinase [Tritrichomonas foetus]